MFRSTIRNAAAEGYRRSSSGRTTTMTTTTTTTKTVLNHPVGSVWKSATNNNNNNNNNITMARREMCGLFAAVQDVWSVKTTTSTTTNNNYSSSPPAILTDNTTLSQTTCKLSHRGPDGWQVQSGVLGSSNNNNNNNHNNNKKVHWSMGHTRLAIVDPSNRFADMPFHLTFDSTATLSGTKKVIHLAANGEIYNHEAIYAKLKHEDHWPHDRISGSDCEMIGHAYAKYGGPATAQLLDGMFAFVILEEEYQLDGTSIVVNCFAARDPVGIKPLYYGKTMSSSSSSDGTSPTYLFSSELKALVGQVDPTTVVNIPPGHYFTPETGLVRFYNPEWLRNDDYAPWQDDPNHSITDDDIRQAFTKAVQKRMMSDVDYGLLLSGGVDSCIVAHDMLPLVRAEREAMGDDRPLPTYTVGMANSPDVMAAKAMVEALGGAKYIQHHVREFTADEVFDLIPLIVYHMETYEAELIRSAIPNWLLAERAAQDVKMVMTGEGADEIFAGYLYFANAETPAQVQTELKRIYNMLGNVNLHRTDRMTMAHGLEARVPFLDTEFTRLVMSIDPARKMVDPQAVAKNARGREKTLLRELFEGPNANGDSIPRPILWRAKAMQCEGVGEDWVSILQRKIAAQVSDAELADASVTYPINTPQTKEEVYYRRIYDSHYHGMEHAVNLWQGGGRAMGAAWKSDMYTREGLTNVNLLSHALQEGDRKQSAMSRSFSTTSSSSSSSSSSSFGSKRSFGTSASSSSSSTAAGPRRGKATLVVEQHHTQDHEQESASLPRDDYGMAMRAAQQVRASATSCGYNEFEAWLTTGGDDRSLIKPSTGANKYHIAPQPIDPMAVFRGSCTGNPPTQRGYDAAQALYHSVLEPAVAKEEIDPTILDQTLREVFESQRQRLTQLLQLPEGTEVILCPSGSDAEYLPLAIARALQGPHVTIVNGVTQVKEIGAGSAPAAVGQYFSTHAPLVGELADPNGQLAGFKKDPSSSSDRGLAIGARNRDGSIVDAEGEMQVFLDDALAAGKFPIVHGVFGGKTGLRDTAMPKSLNGGDTSLGVVDACQGRFTLEELHGWLAQDSLVLFTGSKFYQAPPFCGAVIVPKTIAAKLRVAGPPEPVETVLSTHGLGGFLTDKELPPCMSSWMPALTNESANNVGLALRWEAGLAGMEALLGGAQPHNEAELTAAVNEWASSVKDLVQSESNDLLDAWCVERSIVSIRMAKNNQGGWLNMDEARDLYRWMSMDVSGLVEHATLEEKAVLSKPAYLGQPVDVSESHAIVRIAMGVESLLSYLSNPQATLDEDRRTVAKITAITKYFDILKQSGQ
jgi:asparagine synthase (glutamine-hydrolysing)